MLPTCTVQTTPDPESHQVVWDARTIDAPVVRFTDGNTDGDLDDTGDNTDHTLYYTGDANMSVTALLDTSGNVVERYLYDAYGRVTVLNGASDQDGAVNDWSTDADNTSDWDNQLLYCGYRHDPTIALYHVRHRVYDPELGRWLQRDPLGYVDGMSLYEYVGSSPFFRVDWDGATWRKVDTANGTTYLVKESMGWQHRKLEGQKDNERTRHVKNCHVVVNLYCRLDLEDKLGGRLRAGDGNTFLESETGTFVDAEMSAYGMLTCNADKWSKNAEWNDPRNRGYNYVPTKPGDMNVKYHPETYDQWQPRLGLIHDFPLGYGFIGKGSSKNSGYGKGRKGLLKLCDDAWNKALAHADGMAADCKGQCDEIVVSFICSGDNEKAQAGKYCTINYDTAKRIPCRKGCKNP